jgi:hypothetical protein
MDGPVVRLNIEQYRELIAHELYGTGNTRNEAK